MFGLFSIAAFMTASLFHIIPAKYRNGMITYTACMEKERVMFDQIFSGIVESTMLVNV